MTTRTTIHVLPIEPFDERYTADWYEWWPDELRACGFDVRLITGFGVGGATGDPNG